MNEKTKTSYIKLWPSRLMINILKQLEKEKVNSLYVASYNKLKQLATFAAHIITFIWLHLAAF